MTLEDAVERSYDDILRYFLYHVRSRDAAEDLTQETFCRFLRYSADPEVKFRTPQKCRAYIFAIASNVCRDYFSGRQRTETAELDERIPAEEPDRDLPEVIANALSRLTEAQRETAILYYYSGFKVKEIAAIQGVTVYAVKNRLQSARNALKKILSEEGFS